MLKLQQALEADWAGFVGQCCEELDCYGAVDWNNAVRLDSQATYLAGFCDRCGSLNFQCKDYGTIGAYDQQAKITVKDAASLVGRYVLIEKASSSELKKYNGRKTLHPIGKNAAAS